MPLEIIEYNKYLTEPRAAQNDFLKRKNGIRVEKEVGNRLVKQADGSLVLISSPSLSFDEFFIFPAFNSEIKKLTDIFDIKGQLDLQKPWRIKRAGICRQVANQEEWEIIKKGEIIIE